jgi:hypothetical protein
MTLREQVIESLREIEKETTGNTDIRKLKSLAKKLLEEPEELIKKYQDKVN